MCCHGINVLSWFRLFPQASHYSEVGKVTGNGLVKGHAYAVTRSTKASTQTRPYLDRHAHTWTDTPTPVH